ncbi:MAG: HD domain-containing protein [Actinobacteria bacterium]|nr:MAG: HD domain-containing protein [Actinomycetota bacterium]
MLRVPAQARVLMAATFGLGISILAAAVLRGGLADLSTLALFATAVVLTELFQVEDDETSLDPRDAHISSFSTAVRFAAVIVLGPWAAALVAAFGVVAVDGTRGRHWSKVCFNASAFAASALTAGLAFQLAGGRPGSLDLPADFGAVAAMALVHMLVNTGLVASMIAATSARPPWPTVLESTRSELLTTVEEAGLGVLVALCALVEPWALAALVPLLVAVYHAHSRLALLRRETARALETFANVVDERDPYTYRHSLRVADYVRRLADGLRLPATHVFRLHWAGRLHDLGKIAVDAAVLRKPSRLNDEEWTALRRHPRLSARLLQRFRFAAGEARAVEFHHERIDGRGYYGIDPKRIPLSAHFLIVADSYDAMRSDRPYRLGMSSKEALAEIERESGSQFHPAVAKAFVALERGEDPFLALTPAERIELRRLSLDSAGRPTIGSMLKKRPELSTLAALSAGLVAVSLGILWLAALAWAVGVAGILWRRIEHVRAGRLVVALRTGLEAENETEAVLRQVAGLIAYSSPLTWAGLLAWHSSELEGHIAAEWGGQEEAPAETAITSWLLRETESTEGVIVASAEELGRAGACLALPIRSGDSVSGYALFLFARTIPGHVEQALRRCGAELVQQLSVGGGERPRRRLEAVS